MLLAPVSGAFGDKQHPWARTAQIKVKFTVQVVPEDGDFEHRLSSYVSVGVP
jgi:hypothetical protein